MALPRWLISPQPVTDSGRTAIAQFVKSDLIARNREPDPIQLPMPESPRRASYWAVATGTWLGDVKPSWCLSVRGETSGSAGVCAVGGGKSAARLALDRREQAPRRALLS